MRRGLASTSAAGVLLAALVCVPGPAPVAAADEPVRILVVGDSISQGSAGDWTWRYRLWQHLTGHGVAVDFVGYRDDLRDEITHTFGNQDYVDPAFDRDHAARWGMRLSAMDVPIADLVAQHQPDVVVELLGDNDLSAGTSPEAVAGLLDDFVASARSADPGIDIVLTRDPRPLIQPNAPEFNELVTELAAELDSPASPVVVADADVGYDDFNDTWDGAHPNARGEVKIAAAVADALHELGVGPLADRPVPVVLLGPRIPPVLSAEATVQGADLEWVRAPGAQESEVWQRDVTTGEAWHRVAEHVTGLAHSVSGLPPWHRVQFQTKPLKGFWIAQSDAWSNVVEVEVLGDHLDQAQAPAVSASGAGRLTVTWSAVAHAADYGVEWRRADQAGAWAGAQVAATTASVDGLAAGTDYLVRVRALRDGVPPGAFSPEVTVRTAPAGPVRILLVGDSVTQGSAGDWTWRYRLWQHLQATSAVPVDLVGPRNDLYDRRARTGGNHDYLDPAFDTDHAAAWGGNLAVSDVPVQQLVATYRPDVVVALLGVNDLALGATAAQVGQGLENLILQARAGDQEVDVVLGELVQGWTPGVSEVNDHLHGVAAAVNDPVARVVVAETADGFGRRKDTYDGQHPSSRGEVVIASAVADALARVGVGQPAARPEAVVPLGPRVPVRLRWGLRHGKVRLAWSASPGADEYRVLVRVPGSGGWRPAGDTTRRHWVLRDALRGVAAGERVRFTVLPRKGRHLAEPDVRSNVVRVTLPPAG